MCETYSFTGLVLFARPTKQFEDTLKILLTDTAPVVANFNGDRAAPGRIGACR